MRRRPQKGEITWVADNPHRPKGGWGGGCEVRYHSQYAAGDGPHFADASSLAMRAIACLATARGQRGALRPIHAPVAPPSAALRALAAESWTVPAGAGAFLRAAGLGEIADGLAKLAAAKA